MQIDIDFEVFKALTARRASEAHSYNDVLRELLHLDSIQEPEAQSPFDELGEVLARPLGATGFYAAGALLPNGTALRARYKQRVYTARIEGNEWLDADGRKHSSASAAAAAITGTNVNGLRFWEAMRPTDSGWKRLELLRDR